MTATANAHTDSDVTSALTEVTQSVPGPYNARSLASVEDLDVVTGPSTGGLPVLSASAIRAEAVAVCSNGSVSYSANSEIVDLSIGDAQIDPNTPVTEIIGLISDVLEQAGSPLPSSWSETSWR